MTTLPATDLTVDRGDSVTILLPAISDDNGPIDLTQPGVKMWLTVKTSRADADPGVIQLTESSGITLNSPASTDRNNATAFIPKTAFADRTVYADRVVLYWDAELELGARHETIARGKLWVTPDVGVA